MVKVILNLSDDQAKSLLDAVSKDDKGRPRYGDTWKSDDRKMLQAKVMVAIESGGDDEEDNHV